MLGLLWQHHWLLFLSRMRFVFAVVLLGLQVQGNAPSALSKVWEEWTVKHSKSYDNQVGWFLSSQVEGGDRLVEWVCWFQTEMAVRRAAWERNVQLVLHHNLEAWAGKRSFTLELNHLADMVRRALHLHPSVVSKCRWRPSGDIVSPHR